MNSLDKSQTQLSADERKSVSVFCEELLVKLGTRLSGLALYGSAVEGDYRSGRSDINLLAVVDSIDLALLKSLIPTVSAGSRRGIALFLLSHENLKSSADVFPVKFLRMQEAHLVLAGRDVLGELEISREHLRLRCEQEIKNLLLRLRQHYLTSEGKRLGPFLTQSFPALIEDLRVLLSLTRDAPVNRADLIAEAAAAFEFDAQVLHRLKQLHDGCETLSADQSEQLYGAFMVVVEKLAQAADRLVTT